MTAVREHVYTATERRKELRDLAGQWHDTDEDERDRKLVRAAHPSLPAWGIASAWAEYLDAHRVAADLRDGAMHWSDWDPALSCADRQGAAAEEAAMWAAGILDTLVNGARGR